jgi:heterodisulfide reductase subunit A
MRLYGKPSAASTVDHGMGEETFEIEVGSVILSPGFDEFDAAGLASYGYGRYPNVITSIQFERILSASGPHQGALLRPSDGKPPRKVAWVQCAGSRDMTGGNGNEYCSSVCCMYAIKEAVIAKEHHGEVEPTVFYMDIRCQGKDFDAYFERAKREYGVRFVRCMISRVAERPRSKDLAISYIDEKGKVVDEEFDLVVLSVGLIPPRLFRDPRISRRRWLRQAELLQAPHLPWPRSGGPSSGKRSTPPRRIYRRRNPVSGSSSAIAGLTSAASWMCLR